MKDSKEHMKSVLLVLTAVLLLIAFTGTKGLSEDPVASDEDIEFAAIALLGCDLYKVPFDGGHYWSELRLIETSKKDTYAFEFSFSQQLTGAPYIDMDGPFMDNILVKRSGDEFKGVFEGSDFSFTLSDNDGTPELKINPPEFKGLDGYKVPSEIFFSKDNCEYFNGIGKPAIRMSFFGPDFGGMPDMDAYMKFKEISGEFIKAAWKRELLEHFESTMGDEGGSETCIKVSPAMEKEVFDNFLKALRAIKPEADSHYEIKTDFDC